MPKVKDRAATENDLEDRIRRALDQRDREGTTLRELAILYNVPRSTLSDRTRGGKTQQKAHEDYQALTPRMEKALEQWVDTWDERGFPPRLDLFKAVAAQLAKRRAEEEGDPSLAELGPTWLRGYLNRHPTYSTKFSVTLDRQRALASNPTLNKDYFQKLGKVLKSMPSSRKICTIWMRRAFYLATTIGQRSLYGIDGGHPWKHRMDPENGLQLWNVHWQASLCYHQ